jgi:hypothetical protein
LYGKAWVVHHVFFNFYTQNFKNLLFFKIMTEEQKTTNKAAKIAKQMRNTPQAKSLKNEFLNSILNHSKNLPEWGNLNVKLYEKN